MQVDVILLNGFAESGKDTFVQTFSDMFQLNSHNVTAFSCAEIPKDSLFELGWNGEKTQEIRTLLKDLVNFYTSTPTYLFDLYVKMYGLISGGLKRGVKRITCFYHARELDRIKSMLIDTLEDVLNDLNESYPNNDLRIKVISLYIRRIEQTENTEIDYWNVNADDYDIFAHIKEGRANIEKTAEMVNMVLLESTSKGTVIEVPSNKVKKYATQEKEKR